MVLPFDLHPRNIKSNHPGVNVGNEPDINVVGIAPGVDAHAKLGELLTTTLLSQLGQCLLKRAGQWLRLSSKYRRGDQKKY
jgi:hypothetical protein